MEFKSEIYSKRINEFLSEYEKFSDIANDYESKLAEFNEVLKNVMDNQKNVGTETLLKNENDGLFYILSKEKVLMHVKNDINLTLSDASSYKTIDIDLKPYENKIIAEDVYGISGVYYKLEGHEASIIGDGSNGLTNTIAQVGLEDLSFSNTDNFSLKSIPNTTTVALDTNSSSSVCLLDDAYKCESHAKMNNVLNYGVLENSVNNKCECYIFENINTLNKADSVINTFIVESTNTHELQYLGLLFDGGLYGLKEKTYSNNFTGSFNPDEDKMVSLVSSYDVMGTQISCNPFTGHGPYDIIPNSFDQNGICNVKNTEYENMYSQTNINVSDPKYLNICSNYDSKTTNMFTYDYKFSNDNENFDDSFYTYIGNKFTRMYLNTSNDLMTCNDSDGNEVNPSIDVNYQTNGNTQQISSTTYGSDFMNSVCSSSPETNCDISNAKLYIDASYNMSSNDGEVIYVKLMIEYEHDGTSYNSSFMLYENDGTNTIYQDSMSEFSVLSDVKYEMNLDSSTSKIEMLVRSTLDDSEEEITGNMALYSSDNKIRLIIGKDDGLLKLQTKEINSSTISSSTFKHGTYDNSNNDIVLPINTLSDEEKNKVGSNFDKIGYIGYDNTMKLISNENNIIRNSEVNYTNYPYYSHNDVENLEEYTGTTIDESCAEDTDCMGYITKVVSGTNNYYKISKDEINGIYSSDPTYGTNYEFNLKKNGVKVNDMYLLNSDTTNVYDITSFKSLKETTNDNAIFVDNLIKKNQTELNESKEKFMESYINIVTLFEKLSDSEMEILRQTGMKSNEISDVLKRYTVLYMNINKKKEKSRNLDIEKDDFITLNNRTRIHMAAAGLGTLLSLLALFRIMRR